MMKRHQRGAALLLLMTVLVAVAASAGLSLLAKAAAREPAQWQAQATLAVAAEALRGQAFQRHCLLPALPDTDLLACPDAGGVEGQAAAACPGVSRGWLPWRTLGLPPLRDDSGTCLWYERQGTTARVIAAGPARAGQDRSPLPARGSCGGNDTPANYLDADDAAIVVTLDLARFTASCP